MSLFSFLQPQQVLKPQFEYERNPAPRRPLSESELLKQMGLSIISLTCICAIVGLVIWRHKQWQAQAAAADSDDDDVERLEDTLALVHGDAALRRPLGDMPRNGAGLGVDGGINGGGLRRRRGNNAEEEDGGGAMQRLMGRLGAPLRGRRAQRRDRIEALGLEIEERRRREEEWTRRQEAKERARQAAVAREEAVLDQLRAQKKLKADAEYDVWRSEMKVEKRGEEAFSRPASSSSSDGTDKRTDTQCLAFSSYLIKMNALFEKEIVNQSNAGLLHDARQRGSADNSSEEGIKEERQKESYPQRVVELGDASSRFGISVEKITEIIDSLVSSGSITGIIDERGKFIFVSEAELNTIAKFVRQRGKVSIAEVTAECNRLVSLA